MKKLQFFFAAQIFVGLCHASAAHAQSLNIFSSHLAHPAYRAGIVSACGPISQQLPVWLLAVAQPPLTLPAMANYEVGRKSLAVGARCSTPRQRPVYEVELWQVVPKTLLFSASGQLLPQPR